MPSKVQARQKLNEELLTVQPVALDVGLSNEDDQLQPHAAANIQDERSGPTHSLANPDQDSGIPHITARRIEALSGRVQSPLMLDSIPFPPRPKNSPSGSSTRENSPSRYWPYARRPARERKRTWKVKVIGWENVLKLSRGRPRSRLKRRSARHNRSIRDRDGGQPSSHAVESPPSGNKFLDSDGDVIMPPLENS
jgi:hypothetical protein